MQTLNVFMKYTLHQLEIFVRLSRTLSVTQTAEELNLSQPAVSIQLKNFQHKDMMLMTMHFQPILFGAL